MNSTRQLHSRPTDWLEGQLASYVDAFTHYLSERRYAPYTIDTYLSCIAHFARWMSQCQLDVHRIDEDVVQRFLENHLPQCACARPVHRTRNNLRAALRHLLVVLRAEAVIAEPVLGTTPIDEELCRFDDHMNSVRGLAPTTRSLYLRTVRRLLLEQFGNRPVILSAITPEDVRRFVASQRKLYSTPSSAGSLGGGGSSSVGSAVAGGSCSTGSSSASGFAGSAAATGVSSGVASWSEIDVENSSSTSSSTKYGEISHQLTITNGTTSTITLTTAGTRNQSMAT